MTVHHFRVWDPYKEEWFHPSHKSTERVIRQDRGEIIPGTAEEVDPSQLDAQGRYVPKLPAPN